MNSAYISSVAAFIPPDTLSNYDLEQMVDTTDEWIKTRTGIENRHILRGEGLATSDMVIPVIQGICAEKNLDPEEIDCLIVATTTPDYFFPSTANISAYKTGLKRAWSFDLLAACSGFVYALQVGSSLVQSGRYKKVIVVGADKMSSIVDYTDRTTCILFGDAAAGVLLEPIEDRNFGLLDSSLHVDGIGKDLLYMRAGGSFMPATMKTVENKQHFLNQQGSKVFKHAVSNQVNCIRDLMQKNNLKVEDIRYLIPHQANLRIMNAVKNELDFPDEKITVNIQKYGNTTAATIPLCLFEWRDKFQRGDNLILSSFGAGFTWGAFWVRWY